MEKSSYHMPPDEFRKWGYAMVDWITEYWQRVAELPVRSPLNPGDVRSRLPEEAPENGEEFSEIMKDLEKVILPGITHWQSPNFFAYFPANASGPAVLGELLSAGLGVQGMLWSTSPACTELETHVLDWLVKAMGLPESFLSENSGGGVIQDSASSAALCAIIAAREKKTNYRVNEDGNTGNLVAYISDQAHSSVEKGIKIAGIGQKNMRKIPTTSEHAMNVELLKKQIETDLAAGLTPFFVAATIGTTSSNAMDPLLEIGAVAVKYGLWMHVDAAMSGTAALCPEYRHFFKGLEFADSYCFNPHKWMFTNFDCDCFYVKNRADLIRSLSILPEYLKNKATESGAVIDYRDWQIPLGRRFRALKLWFVLRYYGISGLQFHIRRHVELAAKFESWIKAHPEFKVAAPRPLNLVCFYHVAGDEFNEKLLDKLNQSGKLFLTHTRLDGKFVIRMSIGQTFTEQLHVENAWKLITHYAEKLKEEM